MVVDPEMTRISVRKLAALFGSVGTGMVTQKVLRVIPDRARKA